MTGSRTRRNRLKRDGMLGPALARKPRRRANRQRQLANQGYQIARDQTALATLPPQRPRNAPGPPRRAKRNLPKKHLCIDPMICRWSALQADPFNAPFGGVHFPINKDLFPCQKQFIRNYCSADIVAAAGTTDWGLWFFPMGQWSGNSCIWRPVTDATPATRMLGPCCNSVVGGIVTAAASWCFMHQQNTSFAAVDTLTIAPVNVLNTWVPYESYPEVVLLETQNGPSTSNGRTIAYGIRISYTGDLSATRGYVEFFQPTEYPGGTLPVTGNLNTMSANRRGPAYRRHYFSSHRTFTYMWEPICDEIDEAVINAAGTLVNPYVPVRLAAHIGGIEQLDQFTVEVMCIQELSGKSHAGQAQITSQSPDATHLANAIVANYGATNAGGDAHGKETPPITFEAATLIDKAKYAATYASKLGDLVETTRGLVSAGLTIGG